MKKILLAVILFSSARMPLSAQKTLTFTGTFKSVQGVMTRLSCFCGNGATFTPQNSDKKMDICFSEKLEANKFTGVVTIKGHYVTQTVEASDMNPCPGGSLEVFQVTEVSAAKAKKKNKK